jgi:hypothetical protein
MPYLHWEKHKTQKKMSEEIKNSTQMHVKSRLVKEYQDEFSKRYERIKCKNPDVSPRHSAPEESKRQRRDREKREKEEKEKEEKKKKPLPLGQYLLQIAKLYDALDIESDARILRDHLFGRDSPLHPRRTLDQSYYWKFSNTDERDRDQVVYRETKVGKWMDASKTARVIMVDQLWMYILDDSEFGIYSFAYRI